MMGTFIAWEVAQSAGGSLFVQIPIMADEALEIQGLLKSTCTSEKENKVISSL
jgi:hypothetical protein